ncbi:MAG: signal recognition particle-docking protein FtsY [Candidatus Krumholzibacteriia bacterium]
MGLFDRFRTGLRKTRQSFVGGLRRLLGGGVKLDEDTLDEIEELLITADMGVQSAVRITRSIEARLRQEGGQATLEAVLAVIRHDVSAILTEARPKVQPPTWEAALEGGGKKRKKGKEAVDTVPADTPADVRVIFVVGVNGTGKTTSIAKLANLLQNQGHTVMLAAGDTFRAAAVEQLQVWADRVGVPCISQGPGADPAAVTYDAINAAAARGCDTLIVDTAGRLHTKTSLMDELAKVARVIRKRTGRDPETLLVVDGNTGQNGLAQARIFAETVPVEGLILTKLDGTAKGGIVVAIAETLGLPVLYVGMGESVDDIAVFDAEAFCDALFANWAAEDTDGD